MGYLGHLIQRNRGVRVAPSRRARRRETNTSENTGARFVCWKYPRPEVCCELLTGDPWFIAFDAPRFLRLWLHTRSAFGGPLRIALADQMVVQGQVHQSRPPEHVDRIARGIDDRKPVQVERGV